MTLTYYGGHKRIKIKNIFTSSQGSITRTNLLIRNRQQRVEGKSVALEKDNLRPNPAFITSCVIPDEWFNISIILVCKIEDNSAYHHRTVVRTKLRNCNMLLYGPVMLAALLLYICISFFLLLRFPQRWNQIVPARNSLQKYDILKKPF